MEKPTESFDLALKALRWRVEHLDRNPCKLLGRHEIRLIENVFRKRGLGHLLRDMRLAEKVWEPALRERMCERAIELTRES
jgi:hypothetical protein